MHSPPPDNGTQQGMEAALGEAAHRLAVTTSLPCVWGWNGRTISSRAGTDHWLRVEATPDDRAGTPSPLQGITRAENVPDAVPRPRPHATVRLNKDGWTHDASLLTHNPHPVVPPHTP